MNLKLLSALLVHAQHTHGIDLQRMIISSLVHGLTYGAIFKIFHNISPLMAGVMAVAGIGVLWFIFGRRK